MMEPRKLNRLMLLSPLLAAGVVVAVFTTSGRAPAAAAPAPAPAAGPRIAVVNHSRLFMEMKETKALTVRLGEEMAKFDAMRNQKKAEIEQTLSARDQMKPDHPQYEDLNNKLIALQAEAEAWMKTQAMLAEQRQKRQTKMLFEKVLSAVAEVARQQNIDLVIADTKQVLPEGPDLDKADIRALRAAINQKDVLFASERLDISNAVLAHLDARFQAGGTPAAAPGAGAGAGKGAIPAAGGQRGNK